MNDDVIREIYKKQAEEIEKLVEANGYAIKYYTHGACVMRVSDNYVALSLEGPYGVDVERTYKFGPETSNRYDVTHNLKRIFDDGGAPWRHAKNKN
jgi:hypothetical protein